MDKRKNPKIDLWYYPLPKALSREENDVLIAKYLNEQSKEKKLEIRNKIVEGNLRFVAYFINVNCRKYVDLAKRKSASEDLMQIGTLALLSAIEKFDPSYSMAFSTYLGRAIYREVRDYACNLYSFKNEKSFERVQSTEEGREEIESIEDYIPYEELAEYKIDKDFIVNNILPQLDKRNVDIFIDYYFNEKTMRTIGKERNLSREGVSQIVEKTKNQVIALYNHGNNFEALVEVNFYSPRIKKKYDYNKALFKQYGKEFLSDYFIYKLTKNQAEVFKSAILEYKGETIEEMAKKLGYSERNFMAFLGNVYKKLETYGDEYYREYTKGRSPQSLSCTVAKENIFKRFQESVQKYGREFLREHFLPTLNGKDKTIFVKAVLDYNGEKMTDIAKQCKCTTLYLQFTLNNILEKLNSTDLEKLVNQKPVASKKSNKQRETVVEIATIRSDIAKLGERFVLDYFLPSLTPFQRKFFEDMYINQKYTSYAEFALAIGKERVNVSTLKREVLIKFYNINKNELIYKQKGKKKTDKKSLEVQHKISSKVYADLRLKHLDEYGGVDFLMKYFYPKLPENLQIFFKNYIVKGCSRREVLAIFNSDNINIVKTGLQMIKLKLKEFKLSYSDFEGAIKDFYAHKSSEEVVSQ